MKISFCTLGCKVNQYETEYMREIFEKAGYTVASESDTPDVFVLNSCTVTEESDKKSLRILRKIRQKYPDCITVICGCMAQAFPEEAEKSALADIVFGNTDHSKIPVLVERFLKDRKPVYAVEKHKTGEKFKTYDITKFSGRTRAYMKVEDGCNRFCTYCAIPYGRGRVRSRDIDSIFKEAQRLSNSGYCEIVLVGINLSAYGQDTGLNICDAVDAAARPDGIRRVRLGSLEPDHISDEMLIRLKNNPKFCPQFHLSLQSGCDETLKRMNRHYTAEFYEDLVARIRRTIPDAAVTTDIMVGFAGETEEEFQSSLSFAQKVQFARCHIFAYSVRKGTVAEKFENQVDKHTKEMRSRIMSEKMREAQNRFLHSQLDKTFDVLFEYTKDGTASGYTANYTRIHVDTREDLNGKILPVKTLSVKDDYIIGQLCENNHNEKEG